MSIEQPETQIAHNTRVVCDGGGGALGHPKVYLQISDEGFIDCPYCDRRFVLDEKRGARRERIDRAGAGHHRERAGRSPLSRRSGFIFRAYHALPPLSRKSDGLPTGAVAGFSNMLWKLLQDMKAGDRPTHLAVIFDAGRSSFRNAIYGEYKANRTDPPDDLVPQFPLTREATRAFGVPCVEKQGFEADDLIATYARLAREAGAKVTIASSDKDLMQLVRDGEVEMFDR